MSSCLRTCLHHWNHSWNVAGHSATAEIEADLHRRSRSSAGSREEVEQSAEARAWWRLNVLAKAASLGRGLSAARGKHPLVLLPAQWLEALDSKHRYGANLHAYWEHWTQSSDTAEDFFFWLDHGAGRGVDLAPDFPRADLESTCVLYCGAEERARFAVRVDGAGRLVYRESGERVELAAGSAEKLIFVLSPRSVLYVATKVRGRIHHSTFLSGASAIAAGSMRVEDGFLRQITPHSGHYRPTEEDFRCMCSVLRDEVGVDMSTVELGKAKGPKKHRSL